MAPRTFPDTQPDSLGRFWVPESPDSRQPGVVEVAGSQVTLKVSPELTPMWEYQKVREGEIVGVPAKEQSNFVVLGTLVTKPQKITLVGTRTISRSEIGFFASESEEAPTTHQTLRATWCLTGGHIKDPDTRFLGVQIDVTNLAEWALLQSLSSTRYPYKKEAIWRFSLPDGYDEALPDNRGYLTLQPTGLIEPLTIRGTTITTDTKLEVELNDDHGWTLTDAFSRLATPVTSLFTLLAGERCGLRKLSVWDGSEWLSVHGRWLEPDSPERTDSLLLTVRDTGPKLLGQWMEMHERTSPVPQIVAAAVSNEFHTIESEALSLVTAIEALHRILHPGDRRFDENQITNAVVALKGLGEDSMDPKLNESLRSALKQHWWEKSYPQRVQDLAEPVAAAVPGSLGKVNKWRKAVVDQRISLAHGMSLKSDAFLKMDSLNRSIRWMLTLRLLLESGVPADVLAPAIDRSERFKSDRRYWRKHWPTIWVPKP
ncbi:HEPN domain-containing protein [Rhodococcus pyridinivorans]|uniref:ApeA N-terminal domain 1-containing protein n=1 Tax=Rhodococcus pyridinivorans TaxID=103816 RepID=UPI002078AD4C|nr:HEPN domain-containing protein [Rhodococcus pyridinivorans]USI93014.1 hypothetical protein LLA01_25115 [Rhodococcus pyridinivorans]